ncbi:MAG: DNA-binding protein [Flavobacteriaceae bacterium]|nr:DNA-binding protein [Flavobacteriaceae bacterium]|tara:strand:+ start:1773 stop:2171 length:399 start_codon:yes stop_codon:yes gene_type:complete
MALRYRITGRNNSIGKNNKQYIMQAVHKGVVNSESISAHISRATSLSETDVLAVLHALASQMERHLEDGRIVDLDYIGRFKIGFKGKAKDRPEDLSVQKDIQSFHINYQPSVKLKRKLKAGIPTYKEGSRRG